jgi:hypothetical protein
MVYHWIVEQKYLFIEEKPQTVVLCEYYRYCLIIEKTFFYLIVTLLFVCQKQNTYTYFSEFS